MKGLKKTMLRCVGYENVDAKTRLTMLAPTCTTLASMFYCSLLRCNRYTDTAGMIIGRRTISLRESAWPRVSRIPQLPSLAAGDCSPCSPLECATAAPLLSCTYADISQSHPIPSMTTSTLLPPSAEQLTHSERKFSAVEQATDKMLKDSVIFRDAVSCTFPSTSR